MCGQASPFRKAIPLTLAAVPPFLPVGGQASKRFFSDQTSEGHSRFKFLVQLFIIDVAAVVFDVFENDQSVADAFVDVFDLVDMPDDDASAAIGQ